MFLSRYLLLLLPRIDQMNIDLPVVNQTYHYNGMSKCLFRYNQRNSSSDNVNITSHDCSYKIELQVQQDILLAHIRV